MTSNPIYPVPPAPEPPDGISLGPDRLALAIAFGVVLPVVCLALDPIVFRSANILIRPIEPPVLGAYRVVGHSATAIGIASLLTWLVVQRPAGLLAGSLAAGAAFAICLGVILLPLTLIGLLAVVGVLGLVPFGTAWVFVRSAQAAWRAASRSRAAALSAVVGFVVACGLPWALQAATWSMVPSATELAMSADPGEAERGAEQLRWLLFVANDDELVRAFGREKAPDRRRRLADAYRRATGGELETRSEIMED